MTVAVAGIAAGRPERAVEVLEAHMDGDHAHVHPRVFERLAAAYLTSGRVDTAQEVLLSGLETYPEDPGLHLALAVALASGSKWDLALSHWRQVPRAMLDEVIFANRSQQVAVERIDGLTCAVGDQF